MNDFKTRARAMLLVCCAVLATFAAYAIVRNWSSKSKNEVTIGSKSFTESVILGEIGMLSVKEKWPETRHRKELGGTNILFQALQARGIDAYPEYTGTISEAILHSTALLDEETMRKELAAMGIRMGRPMGFNNTYAIGMQRAQAENLGLKRVSDLQQHPELRVGFSDEFMARDDGWPGMQKVYDLPAYRARGMDHAIAYKGVASRSVDLTDVYTTDAEIAYYDLAVLEDDKKYFPDYYAVWLYRDDLEQRAPEAAAALVALEGQIDTPTMIAMNKSSKVEQTTDHNIAAGFLNSKLSKKIPLEPDKFWDKARRRTEELFFRTLEHLMLVAISLSAAIIFATPVGVLAFRWKKFGHHILSAIGVLQTIPSMALLVALVPLLNLGAAPAIVALFYSLLPIVRNTHAGLTGISAAHRETAEVLGLSERARLWMIELPLASPSIFSGIKTAAVINVGTATIGALVGAGGYGQPILTGIRLMDWGLILLGAIPAGLMALGVQGFFSYIERFVVPKGLRVA